MDPAVVAHYQILITRCTSDIHSLEIACLYHGNSQSAGSGQVTEWKHQIPEVHVILEDNGKHIYSTINFMSVIYRPVWVYRGLKVGPYQLLVNLPYMGSWSCGLVGWLCSSLLAKGLSVWVQTVDLQYLSLITFVNGSKSCVYMYIKHLLRAYKLLACVAHGHT